MLFRLARRPRPPVSPGDPGLRAQRGRLRGAGRPAGRRRVRPGRRSGGCRRGDGQHLRVRRGREEGLGGHAARRGRPQVDRPAAGRRRGGLPGRALRLGAGRRPARGRRRARLRPLRRRRRAAPAHPGRRAPSAPRPPGPAQAAARGPRRPPGGRGCGGHSRSRDRTGAVSTGPRPAVRAPSVGGWTAARPRRSRSPPAATVAAPSVRSRRSAAPTSPARGPTSSAEARWLVGEGVRELFLVSENSSSYGKDLGDIRALEALLADLSVDRGTGMDPGLLPAARRDAAEPDRGHQRHRQGGPVLRPVLPARRAQGAAGDAPLR